MYLEERENECSFEKHVLNDNMVHVCWNWVIHNCFVYKLFYYKNHQTMKCIQSFVQRPLPLFLLTRLHFFVLLWIDCKESGEMQTTVHVLIVLYTVFISASYPFLTRRLFPGCCKVRFHCASKWIFIQYKCVCSLGSMLESWWENSSVYCGKWTCTIFTTISGCW